MIEIKSFDDIQCISNILCNNGYLLMSNSENRISLNKGYTNEGFGERVFHIHLRIVNDSDELYFKNYLNEHYEIAKEYEVLKLNLWK